MKPLSALAAVTAAVLVSGCASGGPQAGPPPSLPPLIAPAPNAADVRPVRWTTAWIVEGGTAIDVAFHDDPTECRLLAGVTADEQPDTIVITLYIGTTPGHMGSCPTGGRDARARVVLAHAAGDRRLADGADQSAHTGSPPGPSTPEHPAD